MSYCDARLKVRGWLRLMQCVCEQGWAVAQAQARLAAAQLEYDNTHGQLLPFTSLMTGYTPRRGPLHRETYICRPCPSACGAHYT